MSGPGPAGPELVADCGRCRALCCVAPAFAASADFAIDKAAGHPCPNLRADDACGIHDRLRDRGFPGCVAYDCFGAGQQVVQVVFAGAPRSGRMLAAYEVARQLHELLFYAADALSRPAAAPVHGPLRRARAGIEGLLTDPDVLLGADPAARRGTVAPLLRRASTLVRADSGRGSAERGPGRNLAGRDLAGRDPAGRDLAGSDLAGRDLAGVAFVGADLGRADLSTASLLGADLHGADLRTADLLAADLRGADLSGADLTGALYLTRTQVGATRGDAATRLPAGLTPPAHWSGRPAPPRTRPTAGDTTGSAARPG